YLTTAFVVGAVGAWHLLSDRQDAPARLMLSMALWMATIVAPLQILAGDLHGLNTLEHQPMKIAAMEGHYETRKGAPLILVGWPDNKAGKTHYAIELPKVGSLILTHRADGEVKGLKAFPKEDWPNTPLIFWSFRVMVGIGFAMLGLGLWSLLVRWRGDIAEVRALQWASVVMGPSGFVAVLAGWVTTEAGRQPYTVYGLLRTVDSASPIALPAVAASLVAFIIVYFAVFGAGSYYILRLMSRPPDAPIEDLGVHEPIRAAGVTPGPAQHQAATAHDKRGG
ncbi:MAG: cytochrome ubiquinol oxidase subunit I, partial [Hyphomicrobiaceae bacterium]